MLKLASRTLPLLTLLILTSCVTSGDLQLAQSQSVELPAIPADLKVCFGRDVPEPAPGPKSKRELYRLIADLKGNADAKGRCGERLVLWLEAIAGGFAGRK